MISGEGTIEIELEQFWEWIRAILRKEIGEYIASEHAFGVPRINKENQTIEIDFAFSSETDPGNWAVKPKCLQQWEQEEQGEQKEHKEQ